MLRRLWRQVLVVVCGASLAVGVSQIPALATTSQPVATGNALHRGIPAETGGTPGPVRLSDPGAVLPADWGRSADEAVTVVGDETGLHVLAASEASGTRGVPWRRWVTLPCRPAGG